MSPTQLCLSFRTSPFPLFLSLLPGAESGPTRNGAVIFVGMDTPELPWSEVIAAKNSAEKEGKAYICPGVSWVLSCEWGNVEGDGC